MKYWVVLGAVVIPMAFVLTAGVGAQGKTAKEIYTDKCAVCHGDDGLAKTAKGKKLKVKDVHENVKKDSVDQMIQIVTKGKDPDMDGFGKEFKPDQIKALVDYYRSLAK